MTTAIPYLLQGKNIILVVNGKSHTISKDTHLAYAKIVEALKAKDWDSLLDLVEPKKVIVDFGKGNISIDGDKVLWKDQPFHNALATRMLEMYADGFPIDPMVRFMEKLMLNPSKRSVDQVYGFLEKNKLPITEDGDFLAYKKVRDDYLDIHSGTMDNSVGQVLEMDRNQVDDNPDSHCSTGLHFCSESYLGTFGGSDNPVMILKISPTDVVSIPTDYNGAKGRASRYEVIGQVNGNPKDAFSQSVDTEFVNAAKIAKAAKVEDSAKKAQVAKAKMSTSSRGPKWPFSTPANGTGYFDLVRVNGGSLEYCSMPEAEADAQIEANIRGKKVQLKKIPSGF